MESNTLTISEFCSKYIYSFKYQLFNMQLMINKMLPVLGNSFSLFRILFGFSLIKNNSPVSELFLFKFCTWIVLSELRFPAEHFSYADFHLLAELLVAFIDSELLKMKLDNRHIFGSLKSAGWLKFIMSLQFMYHTWTNNEKATRGRKILATACIINVLSLGEKNILDLQKLFWSTEI